MKDKNINEYYEARSDKLLEVEHILEEYFDTVIVKPGEFTDVDLLGVDGFAFTNMEQELLKKLYTIIQKLYT